MSGVTSVDKILKKRTMGYIPWRVLQELRKLAYTAHFLGSWVLNSFAAAFRVRFRESREPIHRTHDSV